MAKEGAKTDDIEASIVEYFYERQVSGHKCGYCKSEEGFVTNGMWGHRLAGQDYQDLIERGWRRSGKYIYKPIMNRTCCPTYAIRCEVLRFKPSKSQRRVARRMRAFIVEGKEPEQASRSKSRETKKQEKMDTSTAGEERKPDRAGGTGTDGGKAGNVGDSGSNGDHKTKMQEENKESEAVPGKKAKVPRPGAGADPNKPRCRKAKEVRLERRKRRLAARETSAGADEGKGADEPAASVGGDGETEKTEKRVEDSVKEAADKDDMMEEPQKKEDEKQADKESEEQPSAEHTQTKDVDDQPQTTIEELLKLPSDQRQLAHRLELRVVDCYPSTQEFIATAIDSYNLYKKYQMAVHGDKEEELSERSFRRFLCDTPLISLDGPVGWDRKYGSFHMQYYLDGKLLMVAVVDVLPIYLSSVYVFYDPDYSWLDLGVYSALREIELVRTLSRTKPEFKYYCMGYYIHDHPKMNYKGGYRPSYLLCPDTYRFGPIELARPRLDKSKYSRLNDDPCEVERVLSFLGGVLILFERQVIPYMLFRSYYGHMKDRIVVEYASLVGKAVTQRMFLYLLLDEKNLSEEKDEDSDD